MFIRGRIRFITFTLLLLGSLGILFAASADEIKKCHICGKGIQGTIYLFVDRAVGGEKTLCSDCRKLETHCFLCGLPVKTNYVSLKDGRYLCERDNREAIHSEDEVRSICEEVQAELNRSFSRFMTFPTTNMTINSVSQFALNDTFNTSRNQSECTSVYGSTSSHSFDEEKKFMHEIKLLSDLKKPKLMAVFAHESTHAWISENLSKKRLAVIAPQTKEGFCELIAYKLMEAHNETFEMGVIQSNTYSRGQIVALLEADAKYGFNEVLDWIRYGEDSEVDVKNLERIRILDDTPRPAAQPVVFAPVAAAPRRAAPTTLILKGISGTSQRRFALINDSTFEAMEKGKVRLGLTNVTLHCLEIRSNSVLVQIEGETGKKELFLRE